MANIPTPYVCQASLSIFGCGMRSGCNEQSSSPAFPLLRKYDARYCIIFTERYRSGHNGADSKSVCLNGHEGSNPSLSAKRPQSSRIAVFIFTLYQLAHERKKHFERSAFFNEIHSCGTGYIILSFRILPLLQTDCYRAYSRIRPYSSVHHGYRFRLRLRPS